MWKTEQACFTSGLEAMSPNYKTGDFNSTLVRAVQQWNRLTLLEGGGFSFLGGLNGHLSEMLQLYISFFCMEAGLEDPFQFYNSMILRSPKGET